jgi:hypothetical protein
MPHNKFKENDIICNPRPGWNVLWKIMSYNKFKKMTLSLTLDLNRVCYGRLCHNKFKKMTSSLTLYLNGVCYGRLCHNKFKKMTSSLTLYLNGMCNRQVIVPGKVPLRTGSETCQ